VTPPIRNVGGLNLAFSLLVAVLIAGAIRFLPIGASSYPLNDGGLFAHMAADLSANGFLLPATTSYNGEAIPFAYPPLGIYVTAIASLLTGGAPANILRWLPALISTISVLAMFAMASELLRSRWRGGVAAMAFAFMPRSYEWLIVGGGITRSLGLLFALVAIQQGTRMLRGRRWTNVAATGLFGGLTALSHPQAAVFLTVSLASIWIFHFRRGGLGATAARLISAGVIGMVVASPWLIAVVAAHGLGPLLSAGGSALDMQVGLSQLLGLSFGDTSVFDLLTAVGVMGIVVRVARGQWMIPVWLLLTMVVDPRAGATYASVPLALSVVPIVGELLQRMVPAQGSGATLSSETLPQLARSHRAAAIVVVLILFVGLRTAARITVDPDGPLSGLALEHVSAMEWVQQETRDSAVFAVVSGRNWEVDYLSEWFPVLANRTSAATVQGSEWTGHFVERLAKFLQLQQCALRTATCVESWVGRWGVGEVYVFVAKGRLSGPRSPADCCPALRETLAASDRYSLVYDGPGATIFAPVEAVAPPLPLAPTSR